MNDILLIVDDEQEIRNSLQRNLKKWAEKKHIDLEGAASGKEALSFLEHNHHRTAVIISDQKMPLMSGTDFLQKVSLLYPSIVTIILTGNAEASDISSYIRAGIFAFMEKPWINDDLFLEAEKAVNLYKLRKNTLEQDELINSELKLASEFQKHFLKIDSVTSSTMKFDYSCIHARKLSFGGDYCDIIKISDEKYMVLLGDVSGHGLKASYIVAVLKSMINIKFSSPSFIEKVSPENLLEWLNTQITIVLHKMPDLFLAFAVCIIDGEEKKIVCANAGQPPVLVISATDVKELAPPQIALGVNTDVHYSSVTLYLESDDIVLLCTDGIYPEGKKYIHIDKTIFNALLMEKRNKENFTESVINSVKTAEKNILNDDDITLLSIKLV